MAKESIRIRLKGYDHEIVDQSTKLIVDTAQKTGAKVSGPIPLPTERNLYCVVKGPRLRSGYFDASKANAEKLEAIVKAKDPEAKLHTSLVDEDHVKYTSLSFYEKGMIVCRGKNLNGSLIVENTATNHDDEIEREKIEALANDLTELAKQIS